MDITLNTKVAALLEAYPQLEDKLVELSPAFSKLRNPVLRRTIARVTSLQQAAGVAGISPALLVQKLREAAGLTATVDEAEYNRDETDAQPGWFDETKVTVRYDARPVIESGESPMQHILKLASGLEKGEILEIITPFRPVPIIDILKAKGFSSWSRSQYNYFIKE